MSGIIADNVGRSSGLVKAATAAGGGTSWQSVHTASTLTAVAGNGYPINTTSNACTVTLPAGSVGDTIEIVDYAGTFDTNAVTLTTTEKIKGSDDDGFLKRERQGVKLVYVDATQGWEVITGVNEDAPAVKGPEVDAEYLVVGGGAGSGAEAVLSSYGSAGGAGGYRTNYGSTAIVLSPGTVYTMTVGTGGAAVSSNLPGNDGVASSIAGSDITTVGLVTNKITASGGGHGAGGPSSPIADAGDGGSGGGTYTGGSAGTAGSGNVGGSGGSPSIPEGFDGEKNSTGGGGGAGGGAGEAGGTDVGFGGGDGLSNSITGSAVTYAGGGSGCVATAATALPGGDGGGGAGARFQYTGATDGTDGLGGGGGGHSIAHGVGEGAGGDGVIFLRVPTASLGTPSGNETPTTDGSDTIIKWLSTGSYTA